MSHTDVIRQSVPGRDVDVIIEGAIGAWGRAGDLIVGSVFVSGEPGLAEVKQVYDMLDDDSISKPLSRRELWNLVLLVRVPEGRQDLARRIAQDLRYSRKVPYLAGDPIPLLAGALSTPGGAEYAPADNPILAAVQRIANNEERMLIERALLAKDRRDHQEVERLLDLLESEARDG